MRGDGNGAFERAPPTERCMPLRREAHLSVRVWGRLEEVVHGPQIKTCRRQRRQPSRWRFLQIAGGRACARVASPAGSPAATRSPSPLSWPPSLRELRRGLAEHRSPGRARPLSLSLSLPLSVLFFDIFSFEIEFRPNYESLRISQSRFIEM